MRCQEVMELMQRYLDMDLAEAEEQTMLAHLRVCPECSDMFERLKLLQEELAELPKVAPPYSIVDSILPKLEELALWQEPGAASDSTAAAPARVASEGKVVVMEDQRERRGLISWRVVAGVAAAGIVLGMFIFSSNSAVHDKSAESMLMDMKGSNNASSTKIMANQAGAPQADNSAGASKDVADTYVAKDQYGGTVTTEPSPQAKGDKPITVDSAVVVRSDTTVTTSSAGGTEQKTQKEPSTKESMGALPSQEKPKAAAAPTEAPREESSPAPAPSNQADSESFRKTVNDTNSGITSFTLTANPSSAPVQQSVSPNGDYTASVKDSSFHLTGKDGRTLFTVSPALKEGERLELGKWTEPAKVTYLIHHADGQSTTFQVDAVAKTETKI